jgi:hypothetical protein
VDASRTKNPAVALYDSTGKFIRRVRLWMTPPIGGMELLQQLPDGAMLGGGRFGWRVFDETGRFRAGSSDRASLVGAFSDGTLLVSSLGPQADSWSFGASQFVIRSIDHSRVTQGGAEQMRVPLSVSSPRTSVSASRPPGDHAPWPVVVSPAVVVGNDVVWTFDVFKWELRRYDATGTLKAIVLPPPPAVLKGATRDIGYPRSAVSHNEMLADDRGRLWLQVDGAPVRGDGERGRRWLVIDVDGRLLGSVVTPAGFRPYQVARDLILGTLQSSSPPGTVAASYRLTPATR